MDRFLLSLYFGLSLRSDWVSTIGGDAAVASGFHIMASFYGFISLVSLDWRWRSPPMSLPFWSALWWVFPQSVVGFGPMQLSRL